jgi:hypothetical protein
MSEINRTRTVLIRDGTPLPTTLPIESEAFLPGWRIVKNLDRQALARAVERVGWNIFYLAGEMRAIVWGRERPGTLRRAVKSILAKQEGLKFNSLEVTRVVAKRFLSIPFMSVAAHSRHIQQGLSLVPARDFVLRMPVAEEPSAGLASAGEGHHAEAATKQYTALVSSS